MANVHFEWLILNNGVEWLAHETTSDRASGHNILMLTIYRARAVLKQLLHRYFFTATWNTSHCTCKPVQKRCLAVWMYNSP